jgi:hypothetical protein
VYVLQSQLCTAQEWDDVSTPTINEYIKVAHLQSLLRLLKGDHLKDLPSKYCTPLDESQRQLLTESIRNYTNYYVQTVYPNLTQFAEYLVQYEYDPSLFIKPNVALLFDDDRFDSVFPEFITFQHFFSFYSLISDFLIE